MQWRKMVMVRRWQPGAVFIVLIGLLAAGCGGVSFDLAATALAPTPLPPPGTPIEGAAAVLTPEVLMGGMIEAQGQQHVYTFNGEAGQAVTIDMEAAADNRLDTFLELRGPNGILLTDDDDGGTDLNSQISNFVLPETGEYTIVAYGFNNTSTGGYSLQMVMGTPVPSPTPSPTAPPGGGPIMVGEARSGAINTPGQVDEWEITVAEGELVTINMRATTNSTLDPYLRVLNDRGQVLRLDDDSGDGLNARIESFRAPRAGTYIINAQGVNDSVGPYEMLLSEGLPPTPTPPPPTPGPSPTPRDLTLELGQAQQNELRPNIGGDEWVLTVTQPMVVEVLLETQEDTFNLYVELEGPLRSFWLVDYSDAASVVYLPSVYLRVPGDYIFRVLSVENRFVDYAIVINPVEAGTSAGGEIAYGQGVSGTLLFTGQQDVWTFEAEAGDVVTIMMNGVEMDAYLELLNDSGTMVASNDDAAGSMDSRIEEVRLLQAGTYTIVASSFRGNTAGQYRLLLFKVGDDATE
jgi:hypothetical protein